jgi:spermidine/putrescine transport system substrate-binding protein
MPRRRQVIASSPALGRRPFLAGAMALAATLPTPGRRARAQEPPQLNVYNWDTYIGETTLDDFTAATGIAVRYDLFASNSELFARLREGNPGYDVIFPTNDWVERMIVAGMLLPLDHDRIPNMANLDPAFADAVFDPGLAHSMPYFWGTVGIGYRQSVASPTSWSALFTSDEHAGRISLLNTIDTVQSALKFLGHSVNTEDPAHLEEATTLLIAAKPNIRSFAPDTGQDLLIAREVDLAMEYNGDILQVMEEDDDLSYVVPEEGSLLWEDCMCIPQGGPHPGNAHAFINFILEAEVHAAIAEFIRYPCPNAAAVALLPEEHRNDPTIYPPREVLERCEVSVYKGEAVESMYQEALTRVLAA